MKENFPKLAKEIDFQEAQEAQRGPKKLDPRRHTAMHFISKLPKINHKEGIVKAAGEKDRVTYKGVPTRAEDCQLVSHQKPHRQEGAGKEHSKS